MRNDEIPHVIDRISGVAAFNSVVSDEFVNVSVRSELGDAFRGGMRARALGDIHFSCVSAARHRIERAPSIRDCAAPSLFKLGVLLEGRGVVAQGGRTAVVRRGDLFLQDINRPYSLTFDDECRMAFVVFREASFAARNCALSSLTACRIEADRGAAGSAADIVRGMEAGFDHLEGSAGRRIGTAVATLAETMLLELGRRAPATGAQIPRRALVENATLLIDERLGDTDLDPATVARECGVSVRYLHRLFAEQGLTVAGTIRTARLARCHLELLDPAFRHLSIAEVAARAGFLDAGHFARAFRACYGTTPTDHRRGHVSEARAESQSECPV